MRAKHFGRQLEASFAGLLDACAINTDQIRACTASVPSVETMEASPSSSSEEEPQRCTPARSHIMFYVLATIAAVVLYVVGIMPNKATEAPAPDVVQRPLAAEIEMSDVAALSTHAPQPEVPLQGCQHSLKHMIRSCDHMAAFLIIFYPLALPIIEPKIASQNSQIHSLQTPDTLHRANVPTVRPPSPAAKRGQPLGGGVAAMDGEQLSAVTMEWKVLKERFFAGEPVDPVFEGIVKDFIAFDVTLQDIFKKVEIFMKGVDSLAEGLVVLAESTTTGLSAVDDQLIKADCCKMKEATNAITRADAPHSAIAKLRRDMDFNIMNPLRCHMVNNRNMKSYLDKRRRRLLEYNIAKREMEDCVKKNLHQTDRKYLSAQSQLESAKLAFHEVDKHIFEWLYILEEYKGDILDSCLQTLKYLQYEFFATSAHSISGVLPARMEFRPMVEMTPEHLEAQVEMALQEAEENPDEEVVTDFSARLIEKLAKDNKNKPGEGLDSAAGDGPAVPVDPLSLSSLLSQGFDEGPARQALRKFKNDTQAALDFLIGGGHAEEEQEEAVRMPTTVRRVQRLKERRRAQQARRKEEEERRQKDLAREETPKERQESPKTSPKPAPKPAVDLLDFEGEKKKPAAAAAASSGSDLLDLMAPGPSDPPGAGRSGNDLLDLAGFDEPPPPTDFSKQIETLPLPEQITLDLSKCEKGPIGPADLGGYG
eukprot:s2533_g6.t2